MANWYYVIGPVGGLNTPSGRRTESPLEIVLGNAPPADGRDEMSPLTALIKRISQSPTHELQTPPPQFKESRPTNPPQRLIAIRNLREIAHRETNPADIKTFKKNIRLIQSTFVYNGAGIDRFYDLQGNLICRIHGDETSPRNFSLGAKQYFAGFTFDFARGLYGQGMDGSQNTHIRTTAYLTKEGITAANRYVLKSIRNESLTYRRQKRFGITRHEAKLKMGKTNTYNRAIGGYNTHINLNGKIEIFTPCPEEISSLLTGKLRGRISETSRRRFGQYVQYATLKRWIEITNSYANNTIGATFRNLATVLAEITPGYK